MKRLWICLAIFLVVVVGGFLYIMVPTIPDQGAEIRLPIKLAPAVEKILSDKTVLVEKLFQDTTVIEGTRTSNQKNSTLDMAAITKLDANWRAAPDGDGSVNVFLTNQVAQVLKGFQQQNPGFIEIFIADAHGLNVGQTNKTSDYYQADEAWWIDSFAKGVGKTYHGEIEFDASSQAEAISIYVPIRDGTTVIGVGKAVVDLNSIKEQL